MNITMISPSPLPFTNANAREAFNSEKLENTTSVGVEHHEREKAVSEDIYSKSSENESGTYSKTGKIEESETGEKKSQTSSDDALENDTDKRNTTAKKESDYSPEEIKEIQELKSRDMEVKTHEQAHIAGAGQHANGGAKFEYKTGPDGKRYATGGEVSIDISKVSDNPEATIKKMQIVRNAALAPANPSQQDRAVASQATRIQMEATAESAQIENIEKKEGTESSKEQTANDNTSNQYKTNGFDTGKGSSLDIQI